MNRIKSALASALLLALLLLHGCGPESMETAHTITSDVYQVEVLTLGGTFEQGENPVELRLLVDGQPTNFRQATLAFATPGVADLVTREAQLTPKEDESGLEGTISFDRAGTWTAQVAVVTDIGPVAGTFDVTIR